jgi:hypothetical protein
MLASLLRSRLSVVASCAVVACDGNIFAPGAGTGVAGPPQVTSGATCSPVSDVGRVTLHRLNRNDYNLTVRDLLGDSSAPANDFPVDDTGAGYDNNADVLSMSPLLYEKYDAAAERLIADAWAKDAVASPNAALRVCDPAPGAEDACARQIVQRLAHHAWRRPVTAAELDKLVGMLQVAKAQGEGFAAGVMLALQAVLLSPHFIFRVELDPDPSSPVAHPLSGSELAARLSYFLWSSTPDDALLEAAEGGQLSEPAAITAQVKRMLLDPRAAGFSESFAGQWLHLRALDSVAPDPAFFPLFNEPLRDAMRQEARLFFQAFLTQPLDLREMMDARFTFMNDALAAHYGLPAVGSAVLQRVELGSGPRGGLLTQAGVLTATSLSTRTSAVRRGKFVLTALLCSAPPPPPPNVPPLSTTPGAGSQRQRLEQATAGGVCVSCHGVINPLGFSMEHFDGIGAFRTRDDGFDIDSSGALPDGRTFADVRGMSSLLKSDPKLTRCVAQNVLTFALGRAATPDEACPLGGQLDAQGAHLSDLIAAVATSPQFTQRRGEP